MRYCGAIIIAALMFLLPVAVFGSGNYSFRHIDSNSGLSSNNVKCIVQDSFGFMWFGTKNGLNRYDGETVDRLNCYDMEKKVGNNNIGALYEDEDKRLWVGTDRGIYVYDQRTDRFTFLDEKDIKTGQYADNWVQVIVGDGKGNVWALLPDVGIFRYTKGKVTHYRIASDDNFKERGPSNMLMDRSGTVWVCTSGLGLYRFDKKVRSFVKVNAGAETLKDINIATICEAADGSLVMGSSDGQLFRYDAGANVLSRISFSQSGKIYLRSLCCFDNEIWVGSQNGLFVLNRRDGAETVIRENPLNRFGLSDNAIYYLYRSPQGDAWVGTLLGGVDYMARNQFVFRNYGLESNLSSRRIRGLAQSSDGLVWIGTEENGLNVLSLSTGVIDPVKFLPESHNITLNINAYGNDVYTGFSRAGLDVIGQGRRITTLCSDITESDNSVYAYCRDSRGNEWVGLGYALYRRDAGSNRFRHVDATGYDWIFAIFESREGDIWFGTMGNGLWRYNPASGKYKSYVYDEKKPNGLRSNSINSIMQDSQGVIWLSTDRGGISRYNASTDNFTSYGIAEGLPDDTAYGILEDRRGNLWFGSDKGLVMFDPQTRAIRVFTVKDGLASNQFNYNSALAASNGMFYFGGIDGLVSFNPDLADKAVVEAPLYFTRLSIFDKEVKVGEDSPLKQDLMFTERIRLPYDKATFSIGVSSPCYGVVGNRKFSYRLDPVNKEWTAMTNGNISFTNLAPGTYRLQVKVENYGKPIVRELVIEILPPWYRSTMAYMFYVLMIGFGLWQWFCWYRNRKNRQIQEQKKLFEVSKEKEIYEGKVKFFTEIAHEIRTPLTLIDAPLEAMEEMGVKDSKMRHYMMVMRQNTRRLLDLTGQLLDFQKIDSNRLVIKREVVDVTRVLNDTVDRFELAMNLKHKELIRNIPDLQIETYTDKEALTKIVSNLLNNALKYAQRTIIVELESANGTFTIKVVSDSRRIDGENRSRIFEPFYQANKNTGETNGVGIGLSLARSLASLLGGTLSLEDSDKGMPDGNTFVLTLPLTVADDVKDKSQELNESDYIMEDTVEPQHDKAGRYTVLLVEDNDAMREFLSDLISRSFAIVVAKDGKEALERLSDNHVDIIVTDIMMPVMDGMELCKAVKADINLSHIPVVFITAKNDLDSKVEGLRCGAEAYIEKPFSIKYFSQLINSILENRSRERESFSKKPFFKVDNMQVNKGDEEFMNKVVKIIEENISEDDFNVEAMTDMFHMSRSSLLRKIKTLFNLSPVELIRLVKLKKGAELIQEGKYRIGDICYMVGIASPSYFSKLFLKQFGISPKDFERQCRKSTHVTLTIGDKKDKGASKEDEDEGQPATID